MRYSRLLIAIFFPVIALAGGSFSVRVELDPILNQVPEIKQYLYSTLDIKPDGWAGRIGQSVNPNFGGRRIGPYHVLVKPKGTDGAFTLELIIHTKRILLNHEGEEVGIHLATHISEEFLSAEIKPFSQPSEISNQELQPTVHTPTVAEAMADKPAQSGKE